MDATRCWRFDTHTRIASGYNRWQGAAEDADPRTDSASRFHACVPHVQVGANGLCVCGLL